MTRKKFVLLKILLQQIELTAYFCQRHGEGNSECLLLFSFPLQTGLEQNSENSESFLFCGVAGIPPEQTNCSIYSVFRGIFLSEIANRTYNFCSLTSILQYYRTTAKVCQFPKIIKIIAFYCTDQNQRIVRQK